VTQFNKLNKDFSERINVLDEVASKVVVDVDRQSDEEVETNSNKRRLVAQGIRENESTLPVYARLMKRCWDVDPNKRPAADELVEIITCWFDYYPNWNIERIPVPSNISKIKTSLNIIHIIITSSLFLILYV
jgi:hypothetical protein